MRQRMHNSKRSEARWQVTLEAMGAAIPKTSAIRGRQSKAEPETQLLLERSDRLINDRATLALSAAAGAAAVVGALLAAAG
jgi:hypothetical protein